MDVQKELRLPDVLAFEWDDGNLTRNRSKHNVDTIESEEVFYDYPLYFFDEAHSQKEHRYIAYGMSEKGRELFIVFTIRGDVIRVISARDQNTKERRIYGQTQTHTKIQKRG